MQYTYTFSGPLCFQETASTNWFYAVILDIADYMLCVCISMDSCVLSFYAILQSCEAFWFKVFHHLSPTTSFYFYFLNVLS